MKKINIIMVAVVAIVGFCGLAHAGNKYAGFQRADNTSRLHEVQEEALPLACESFTRRYESLDTPDRFACILKHCEDEASIQDGVFYWDHFLYWHNACLD